MKSEIKAKGALRLNPCTYGTSRIPFRGPRRPIDGRFVAFLGGSETFAKYVPRPYPDLVEQAVGEVCVNLGCQSAGPDVFLNDSAIETLCHDAVLTVIQVPGAANLSNRFYKVHPRRNDRFISPKPALRALYPEIDFAEIAFTGHLLERLRSTDGERFAEVRRALESTWHRRMKTLIAKSAGRVLLLWLAPRQPDDPGSPDAHPATDPIFVRRSMLEALRPFVSDIIEVSAAPGDTAGMCFPPLEALAAREMLGVEAHKAAAKALREPIQRALL